MKLVVILGDTHINSTVALCPRRVELTNGAYYNPSPAQLWLTTKWESMWTNIAQVIEAQQPEETILILNGDIVDMNVHSRHELISPNISVVLNHAYRTLAPKVRLFNYVYFNKGTEAHTGERAELEETLAAMLNCVPEEYTNEQTRWETVLEVNGVNINTAHHGKVGSREWTKLTAPMTLATEIVLDSVARGHKLPDLVIRNHAHKYADTFYNAQVRVIQNPGWQLSTTFSHKIGIVSPADIGATVIQCEDSKYEAHTYVWNVDKPKPTKH